MKKYLLLVLCMCVVLNSHAQKVMDLNSGKIVEGKALTVPTRDIRKTDDGFIVKYNFVNAIIQFDDLFPGTVFWKMDGFEIAENPGTPSTLFRNDLIVIPSGHTAKVEITACEYNDFQYELTPARHPLLNSNDEVYTHQNVIPIKPFIGYKPEFVVSQVEHQSYRGHNLCQTLVSPIQYNYQTKTVRAYTSITYKISFEPDLIGASINAMPMYLSPEDHLLNNIIGFSEVNENRVESNNENTSDLRDYLILSTPAYSEAVNKFAEWKRLMGFDVHSIIRDDWTSTSVTNAVSEAYTNYPALYYLLIIGDHEDVPAQESSENGITHITDFHYGCIDNDYVQDIYCGRLSVSSSNEALTVVEKIINYEQEPPTIPSFYNNSLHCAYFQDKDYDSYADRRFAQTSEDVLNYVTSQGKTIQRVYTTPSNVNPLFWNNGRYSWGESIPSVLRKPGFAWNGNSSDISSAINNGVFYILHRDHGEVERWSSPRYSQQDVSNLSNENLLPIVFSMNCLTGKFDDYCFSETFLRKPNGGCVGIYGATEVSYSGYNDILTIGMFDAIWPNPGLHIRIPYYNNSYSTAPLATFTMGQILAQGKIRLIETYGSSNSYTRYTCELFHCFGDPSMKMYTSLPSAFENVSISRHTNAIFVDTGESETVRITAYDPVSGEIKSYLGRSSEITISNPYEAIVCVSAHNKIPFIQYPDLMYIQNTNITGYIEETHDVIKIGNHVTTTIETGDVTTTDANITLRAGKVLLDSGTNISIGSKLKINSPSGL